VNRPLRPFEEVSSSFPAKTSNGFFAGVLYSVTCPQHSRPRDHLCNMRGTLPISLPEYFTFIACQCLISGCLLCDRSMLKQMEDVCFASRSAHGRREVAQPSNAELASSVRASRRKLVECNADFVRT